MKYYKVTNLSDNASNQLSKCRAKKWIGISDDSNRTYNTNRQIKFKTAMLKSSLCDYSDAYILVKGTIAITGAGDNDGVRRADERNKGMPYLKTVHHLLAVQVK